MTLVARLAPDFCDRDTVCLNIYCSLNSRARWEIFWQAADETPEFFGTVNNTWISDIETDVKVKSSMNNA